MISEAQSRASTVFRELFLSPVNGDVSIMTGVHDIYRSPMVTSLLERSM